jgi:hypothetical protein
MHRQRNREEVKDVSGFEPETILRAGQAMFRANLDTMEVKTVVEGNERYELITRTYQHCHIEWRVHKPHFPEWGSDDSMTTLSMTLSVPEEPSIMTLRSPKWKIRIELEPNSSPKIISFEGSTDHFDQDMIMARLLT